MENRGQPVARPAGAAGTARPSMAVAQGCFSLTAAECMLIRNTVRQKWIGKVEDLASALDGLIGQYGHDVFVYALHCVVGCLYSHFAAKQPFKEHIRIFDALYKNVCSKDNFISALCFAFSDIARIPYDKMHAFIFQIISQPDFMIILGTAFGLSYTSVELASIGPSLFSRALMCASEKKAIVLAENQYVAVLLFAKCLKSALSPTEYAKIATYVDNIRLLVTTKPGTILPFQKTTITNLLCGFVKDPKFDHIVAAHPARILAERSVNTFSAQALTELFEKYTAVKGSNINEEDAALILKSIMMSPVTEADLATPFSPWKSTIVAQAFINVNEKLAWVGVIRNLSLDHTFAFMDGTAPLLSNEARKKAEMDMAARRLCFLVECFFHFNSILESKKTNPSEKSALGNSPFPYAEIVGNRPSLNCLTQISFYCALLYAPHLIYHFVAAPPPAQNMSVACLFETAMRNALNTPGSPELTPAIYNRDSWNIPFAIPTLLEISKRDVHYPIARAILMEGARTFPDVFILKLAKWPNIQTMEATLFEQDPQDTDQTAWRSLLLYQELVVFIAISIFPKAVTPNVLQKPIVEKILIENRMFLLYMLRTLYMFDHDYIPSIASICLEPLPPSVQAGSQGSRYTSDSSDLLFSTPTNCLLPKMLDCMPMYFAIELITYASQSTPLKVGMWLKSKCVQHGEPFVRCFTNFVVDKVAQRVLGNSPQFVSALMSPFFAASFGTFAIQSTPKFSQDGERPAVSSYSITQENVNVFLSVLQEIHQETRLGIIESTVTVMKNPTEENIKAFRTGTPRITEVIKQEAMALFQNVFYQKTTVDDFANTMVKLRDGSPNENLVYRCVWEFYHQELRRVETHNPQIQTLIGKIFGQFIVVKFFPGNDLECALKTIVDAISEESPQAHHRFGIAAVEQMIPVLPTMPGVAKTLLMSTLIRQQRPDLYSVIMSISRAPLQGVPQPVQPTPEADASKKNLPLNAPAFVPTKKLTPTTMKIKYTFPDDEELTKADRPTTFERVQDLKKVINSMSRANINEKAKSIHNMVILAEHADFLGKHIVEERVQNEANNVPLYVDLVQAIDDIDQESESSGCRKMLATATTKYACRWLLLHIKRSGKISGSDPNAESAERSRIRGVSDFLGLLTLAKNSPIRRDFLPLKEVIVKSVFEGLSRSAITVAVHVLMHSKGSRVFHPQNPWIAPLLKILAEAYWYVSEKAEKRSTIVLHESSQFEIEDLFVTLGLSIEKYKGPCMYFSELVPTATVGIAPQSTIGAEAREIPRPSEFSVKAYLAEDQHFLQRLTRTLSYFVPIRIFAPLQSQAYGARPNQEISIIAVQAMQTAINAALDEICTTAATVATSLVGKDFFFESSEAPLVAAATSMSQSLAKSLVLTYCATSLRGCLEKAFRDLTTPFFQSAMGQKNGMSTNQAEIANYITRSCEAFQYFVFDFCRNAIKTAAPEKAKTMTLNSLSGSINLRRRTDKSEKVFFDSAFFDDAALHSLPPELRPKTGHLSRAQLALYESEIASLPRVLCMTEGPINDFKSHFQSMIKLVSEKPTQKRRVLSFHAGDDLIVSLCTIASLLKQTNTHISQSIAFDDEPSISERIAHFCREVCDIVLSCEAFTSLSAAAGNLLLVDSCCYILQTLCSFDATMVGYLTGKFMSFNGARAADHKSIDEVCASALVCPELAIPFLQHRLLDLKVVDTFFSNALTIYARDVQGMAKGNSQREAKYDNFMRALASIIRSCIMDRQCIQKSTVGLTFGSINKLLSQLTQLSRAEYDLYTLVEAVSNSTERTKQMQSELILILIREWTTVFETTDDENVLRLFAEVILNQGFFSNENLQDIFFRVGTNHAIESFLASGSADPVEMYRPLDAYGKLVVYLLMSLPNDQTQQKVMVLGRALSCFVKVLQHRHNLAIDGRGIFDQRPFQHLLELWIADICNPPFVDDPSTIRASRLSFDITHTAVSTFGRLFNILRPKDWPGFAFSWLDLVSHRNFMPRLIVYQQSTMKDLLVNLLEFLGPYLEKAKEQQMSESMCVLYTGTLRVFTVLFHSYPEFLCKHHMPLCDVIPPSCVQLRNIILSARPPNMNMFYPNARAYKVDKLPEGSIPPVLFKDVYAGITANMQKCVETLLKEPQSQMNIQTLTSALHTMVKSDPAQTERHYNWPLLGVLVLYMIDQVAHDAKLQDVLKFALLQLLGQMEMEGREVLLNAIANQLRYTSSHTIAASRLMLDIFADVPDRTVAEQIARIVAERMSCKMPRPWGIVITFWELMHNPKYKIFEEPYVLGNPEFAEHLRALFDSVCNGGKK